MKSNINKMINKNQVQTLRFREEIIDVSYLEEKYQQKIPPIYRSFITVFSSGNGKNSMFSKEKGFVTPFINFIYSEEKKDEYSDYDDDLVLLHFKSPENFLKDGKHEGWELDTAYIAVHGYGGGLNVGIREHNLDVIYLDERKVANNIFELLHKLIPIINEHCFPNLDLDKIVKRFNSKDWEEIK